MTDYTLGETVYKMFTSRAFSTGIPTVLAGTPVVSAYENDSATQITAGITLGVSHDSVVGMNLLTIVATAANGYESGKDYNLVITTGTVDSVSAVGEVVAEFSIGKSAVYKSQIALAGGVVDSGSTTTIVDAALLTQSTTDHWKGAQVRMTGGTAANIGAVRTITGFTPASDLITFSPALVATVAAADTFEILAGNFGVIDTGNDDGVILSASQSNAVAFAENVSMAKGLTITNSVTNGHGISATGDGTGEGISCTGGSAGHGFRAAGTGVGNGIVGVGGATDGAGLVAAGLAAGAGVSIAGGVTGNGVTVSGGATSGDGINVSVTSGQGLDVDGVDMSTDLTAIKTKTDSLTFTVAGDVDANIQSIVDAGISEGGSDPGSPIGET